jgi:polyisoprenoid-binding protein YceI
MKKLFLIGISLILSFSFLSCGNNDKKNDEENDSTVVEKIVIDTIPMNLETSSISWDRYKKQKNTESEFKIGNSNISMTIDELELTTKGNFTAVEESYWIVEDKKTVNGLLTIDLTMTAGIEINQESKLEITTPEYLDVAKYPTAMLEFIPFENTSDTCSIEAILTIKEHTDTVRFDAIFTWEESLPTSMNGSFTINGFEWGLIGTNTKKEIIADRLTFYLDLK